MGGKHEDSARSIRIVITIIVIIVLILIAIAAVKSIDRSYKRRIKRVDRSWADIIIIGGGVAGCLSARTIHDDLCLKHPDLKILVLERGQDRHDEKRVYNTARALEIAYTAPYSEVLPSETPMQTASISNMLGGGSSHNFGLTVRGSPTFYNNHWQKHLGLSYDDLIPIFRSIENYSGSSEKSCLRGHDGLLQVSPTPIEIHPAEMILPAITKAYSNFGLVEGTKMLKRGVKIIKEIGPLRLGDFLSNIIVRAVTCTKDVSAVHDYNIDVTNCVSKTQQLFIDDKIGVRSSVDVAFLPQNFLYANQRRVQVSQNTAVDKLVFSSKGNNCKPVCTKVKWTRTIRDRCGSLKEQKGVTRLSKCGKVIMAAGAIHTPFILEKSLSSVLPAFTTSPMTTHYGCTLIFKTCRNFCFSTGPIAFVPRSGRKVCARDWQMIVVGEPLTSPALLGEVGLKPTSGNFTTMLAWLMDPRSEGSVSVKVNPNNSRVTSPGVTFGLYSDGDLTDPASDISSIVESLRWMYKVASKIGQDLCEFGEKLEVVYPPKDVMERDNDAELEIWAKSGLSLTEHYNGTCALGKVVSAKSFRVKGTENVHVIDASVFPRIPDANTEFPTCVMAAVASHRISNSFGK